MKDDADRMNRICRMDRAMNAAKFSDCDATLLRPRARDFEQPGFVLFVLSILSVFLET